MADRAVSGELRQVLGGDTWDLAVDTWDGAPRVATEAAQLLRRRVQRYGYVSSMSVYTWGSHVDESSPLVAGDALAGTGEYPALKRGAEMGVLAAHPDAVLARAGLILGPHEDIGRLPWWLQRISRGGRVVAPGRPARPLQYVDARDLASWLLSALSEDLAGPVDVASRSGHATTEQLLQACVRATRSDAELVWVSETALQAHGVEPFTQVPCWVPEAGEFAGFLEADTSRRSRRAGLPASHRHGHRHLAVDRAGGHAGPTTRPRHPRTAHSARAADPGVPVMEPLVRTAQVRGGADDGVPGSPPGEHSRRGAASGTHRDCRRGGTPVPQSSSGRASPAAPRPKGEPRGP